LVERKEGQTARLREFYFDKLIQQSQRFQSPGILNRAYVGVNPTFME
jgi:hypothetical protein